ncbi:MAG TPA: hypothetical protein VM243_18460 [Phycisphaerae bacterium]|nr:hypothetical protein [Phycisphaerae bacterium]
MSGAVEHGTGRQCGTCSLCCKLLGIEELDKPQGQWCPHCDPPHGCMIYSRRPGECRAFNCAWLENAALGDEWKPTRSKMVLYFIDEGARLVAHVDPGTPDAWRRRPWHDQLRAWALRGIRNGPNVVVQIEDRVIAVLPDRDVDLGRLEKGDAGHIGEVQTPAGRRYVARKVPARDIAAPPSETDPAL